MTDWRDDEPTLLLLEELVSGNSVSVNLTELSKELKKHRQTIVTRVEDIFLHEIIDKPAYPFLGLYKVRPLLVTVELEMPDDERFVEWVREDPCIFAAFRCRHCEWNTMLFIYQKDVTSYMLWRESLPSIMIKKYGIPEEDTRFMSTTSYYSNQLMLKYNPGEGARLLEQRFFEDGRLNIKGYKLDELDIRIIKLLASGTGIRTNYTSLCERTGLHRRTIQKRISALIEEDILAQPVCRFPNFFAPPNYLFTLSLIEVRELKEMIIHQIVKDPHIPIALKTISGQYNLLLFSNHRNIGDYLEWDESYRDRFPGCFGSTDITYLTPRMTISFDYKLVGLNIIKERLKIVKGRKLREKLKVSQFSRRS